MVENEDGMETTQMRFLWRNLNENNSLEDFVRSCEDTLNVGTKLEVDETGWRTCVVAVLFSPSLPELRYVLPGIQALLRISQRLSW
jgi:hypothetical protein